MIDRVAARLQRPLYEVPVGFKWFVSGLMDGSLGSARGERRRFVQPLDGTAWTTDKDGMVPALLSAEIMARGGRDPGAAYEEMSRNLVLASPTASTRRPMSRKRSDSPSSTRTGRQHATRRRNHRKNIDHGAGEPRTNRRRQGHLCGRLVCGAPSGTENIYKIYAESFHDDAHLRRLLAEAQAMVDGALAGS